MSLLLVPIKSVYAVQLPIGCHYSKRTDGQKDGQLTITVLCFALRTPCDKNPSTFANVIIEVIMAAFYKTNKRLQRLQTDVKLLHTSELVALCRIFPLTNPLPA